MSFSRDEYWKNRKDGKRGQGEKLKSIFTENTLFSRSFMRRKARANNFATTHHEPMRTKDQTEAIRQRVKKTEAGEKQRIAKKKAALAMEIN